MLTAATVHTVQDNGFEMDQASYCTLLIAMSKAGNMAGMKQQFKAFHQSGLKPDVQVCLCLFQVGQEQHKLSKMRPHLSHACLFGPTNKTGLRKGRLPG